MSEGDGGGIGEGFRCLVRRKIPDSPSSRPEGQQLAKRLSAFDLVAIGVGSTIGAGVYILIGTVARELTGPGLVLSFLIGGIAAALSALCYAELACRCPSAGSAYHYSYICVGEGVAWLIGWALILEYTLGSATVARGISPNLALFFGGVDKLPGLLTRHTIFGLVVDPCAALLVCAVALLLCLGIKESSLVQTTVTVVNVGAMLFVLIAGVYLGFKTGWPGYDLPSGYFPFGINGIFAGSATLFYSYVGFDSVTSTAEEVKNPQRDMPIGIGFSLSLCCMLYMLVSAVIVGLVPYYALDPDTPISSAFASNGMEWAEYIITIGAVTALCSGLIGGILPQPRILMAMARDGLLPSFFSDINKHTKVPVKSTIVTGIAAAALAFSMDIEQLAGMVSVGTLLAFSAAAISVLIVRYVPPDEIPFLSSLQDPFRAVSLLYSDNIQVQKTEREKSKSLKYPVDSYISGLDKEESSVEYPLLDKVTATDAQIVLRERKVAAWNIALVCTGALVLSSSVSANGIPSFPRYALCALGLVVFSCSLIRLISLKQSDAWRSSGPRGGFLCPFVPVLPACCILINIYLLINLGVWTWIRASVWLAGGVLVYVFYGRTHSKLSDRLNIPVAFAAQISQTSQHCH